MISAAKTRAPRTCSAAKLALLVFAISLWLVATLGIGGALGRSTDDHSFNLCDPVTGQPPPISKFDPWSVGNASFWRPVHQVMLYGVRTYFDDYDRAIHIGVAAMHGLVCLLLFRLLRSTTNSTGIAAACSLGFMVFPVHHEVVFWFCTTSTAIGTAFLLWLCLAFVRWSRGPTSLRSWWVLAPMSVIAFAIPNFYEQPGAAIAALPFLYWATCSREQPVRQRLLRALGATFILGMTQVIFAAAMVLTADSGDRGSVSSMIRSDQAFQRAEHVWGMTSNLLFGEGFRDLIAGAWIIGTRMISTSISWVWLIVLALTAAAWSLGCMQSTHADPTIDRDSDITSCRLIWLALFGLAVSLLSILPVAVVSGQILVARMMYVPLLGAFVVFAAFLKATHHITRPAWQVGATRAVGAASFAALLIAGAVCMLGVQRAYQRAAELDSRLVRQLTKLVPKPPPDTLFIPLSIQARATRTGKANFDLLRPGVFETFWSSGPPVRRALRRSDVYVGSRNPWMAPEIRQATPDTAHIAMHAIPSTRFKQWIDGNAVVPWKSIIPFTVDAAGEVRVIREITFQQEDGSELEIRPTAVTNLLETGALHRDMTSIFRLDSSAPVAGSSDLTGWVWREGSPVNDAITVWSWRDSSLPRNAVWMHPDAEGGRRSHMSTSIPSSPDHAHLLFRVVVTEHDLIHRPDALPTEFSVHIDNDQPVSTLTLSRKSVRAGRGWFMIVVDLLPSNVDRTLHLRVQPANVDLAGSSRVYNPCWVTLGKRIVVDEASPLKTRVEPSRSVREGAAFVEHSPVD